MTATDDVTVAAQRPSSTPALLVRSRPKQGGRVHRRVGREADEASPTRHKNEKAERGCFMGYNPYDMRRIYLGRNNDADTKQARGLTAGVLPG